MSKQYTQEQMLQRRKNIKIGICAAVGVAVVAVGAAVWSMTRVSTGDIDGAYLCTLTETNVFHINFDNSTGKWKRTIGETNEEAAGEGTYSVHGDTLTLKQNGNKTKFDIIGDVLAGRDYYYQGDTVPAEAGAFDGVLTQHLEDTYDLTLEFKADGTYTSTMLAEGAEEETVTKGTYEYDGQHITRIRISEDGKEAPAPILTVVQGRVNSTVYTKE